MRSTLPGLFVAIAVTICVAGQAPPLDLSLKGRIAHMHARTKKTDEPVPTPSLRRLKPDSTAAPSSVTLAVSPNPALFGQSVTLTATVTAGAATGNVTFYDGVTVLGSAPVATSGQAAGQAMLATGLLTSGARVLQARFDGNSSSAESVSAKVAANVNVPPGAGMAPLGLVATGYAPVFIAIADFNGDGIPDLATANSGDGTVSILLGNGSGSFQFQSGFNTGGANPFAVVTGDFNNDGYQDVAVVNNGGGTVSILLGAGNGTLQSPIVIPIGSEPFALVAADFNGDGNLDLAVILSGSQSVAILLGVGDGTMQNTPPGFFTGVDPWSIVAGDFNGDGIPDLGVTNSGANYIQVMLGRGDGTFSGGVQLATNLVPSGLIAGDWNNDGKTDLAVADAGFIDIEAGGCVEVFLGNGDGSFQAPALSIAGIEPWALAAGDFNGDGLPDLVVVNAITDISTGNPTNLSLLIGNGDGSFQPPQNYLAGSSPVWPAVADLNGDHIPDVAVASQVDNGAAILTGIPASCQFSALTPGPAVFDAGTGSSSITFTTNSAGCGWTIATPNWIVPAVTTGLGGMTVAVSIQPNTTGLARTGTVTLGGQSTAFSQWETQQQYADVPVSNSDFDAVNTMAAKHITTGCAVDAYCPTQSITRAQMAIFLVRGVYGGDVFTASTQPYFLDVPVGAYGFAWIQKMFELGITTGCGGGNYCPTQTVPRAQMAIFIIRARFGATASFNFPPTPYFTDVPLGAFGFNWIQAMKLDAITGGCSATAYCPNNAVTRGDMAIFLMRGMFNQFLPAGSPAISQISPAEIMAGQSITATITGVNTAFVQNGTTVAPIPGITIGAISVIGPQTLTVQLTASPTATLQPFSVVAVTGSQEATLPNGLVIQ